MRLPFVPRVIDLPEAEYQAERKVLGGLAKAVRRLNLASLQSTISQQEIIALTEKINQLSETLEAERIDGAHGLVLTKQGDVLTYGNAVVGMRNPIAVPLKVERFPEGRATTSFHLSPLYEGPPNTVHGGVVALILDQICGEAGGAGGSPGMTGTLNIKYLQPTPLGDCAAEAWIDHIDGVKTIIKGHLKDAEGAVTAECEGIFIVPKWIRERVGKEGIPTPPRFD